MKKLFISTFLLIASTSLFAQWNNTADSKTTGSLTVGSSADNASSYLKILGSAKNPWQTRDIIFDYVGGGKSIIQAENRPGYESLLHFLVTNPDGNAQRIMTAESNFLYVLKTLYVGDFVDGAQKWGLGTKLSFGGSEWNTDDLWLAKYSANQNATELRVNIGDDSIGEDKLSIGNSSSGSWKSWLSVLNNGNVGIGVENPTNALEVNGTIRAKQVRVETGWADFVFDKEYNLPSLNEVKAHIDEHKHLPGIPTEAQVKENGVDLAEIQVKLLQKVEELTLYAIQQQEQLKTQSEQLQKQNQEIENLKLLLNTKK